MTLVRAALLALLAAACTTADSVPPAAAADDAVDHEFLTPYGKPTLPFSPAVRVGDLIILSGQIGTGADGAVVPGGIQAETRQTLENIKDVLERTGSSMDRVVKCTAMLTDMSEWAAMNEVYVQYFPGNKPARSAFGASGLALGARLELECWAVRGGAAAPDTAGRAG